MRWTKKPRRKYDEWRRAFCLLPVETEDGYCVWLEYVWRKPWGYHGGFIDYIYRVNLE